MKHNHYVKRKIKFNIIQIFHPKDLSKFDGYFIGRIRYNEVSSFANTSTTNKTLEITGKGNVPFVDPYMFYVAHVKAKKDPKYKKNEIFLWLEEILEVSKRSTLTGEDMKWILTKELKKPESDYDRLFPPLYRIPSVYSVLKPTKIAKTNPNPLTTVINRNPTLYKEILSKSSYFKEDVREVFLQWFPNNKIKTGTSMYEFYERVRNSTESWLFCFERWVKHNAPPLTYGIPRKYFLGKTNGKEKSCGTSIFIDASQNEAIRCYFVLEQIRKKSSGTALFPTDIPNKWFFADPSKEEGENKSVTVNREPEENSPLKLLIDHGLIETENISRYMRAYYFAQDLKREKDIANNVDALFERFENKSPKRPLMATSSATSVEEFAVKANKEQRKVMEDMKHHSIVNVTGLAGRGKTWTLKHVYDTYRNVETVTHTGCMQDELIKKEFTNAFTICNRTCKHEKYCKAVGVYEAYVSVKPGKVSTKKDVDYGSYANRSIDKFKCEKLSFLESCNFDEKRLNQQKNTAKGRHDKAKIELSMFFKVEVLIVDELTNVDQRLFSKLYKLYPNLLNVIHGFDKFQILSIDPGNVAMDLLECSEDVVSNHELVQPMRFEKNVTAENDEKILRSEWSEAVYDVVDLKNITSETSKCGWCVIKSKSFDGKTYENLEEDLNATFSFSDSDTSKTIGLSTKNTQVLAFNKLICRSVNCFFDAKYNGSSFDSKCFYAGQKIMLNEGNYESMSLEGVNIITNRVKNGMTFTFSFTMNYDEVEKCWVNGSKRNYVLRRDKYPTNPDHVKVFFCDEGRVKFCVRCAVDAEVAMRRRLETKKTNNTDDDGMVYVDINNLSSAWCMTVDKSMGKGFENVLFVLPPSLEKLQDIFKKRHLHVAITRNICNLYCLVGDFSVLTYMATMNREKKRNSTLSWRLNKHAKERKRKYENDSLKKNKKVKIGNTKEDEADYFLKSMLSEYNNNDDQLETKRKEKEEKSFSENDPNFWNMLLGTQESNKEEEKIKRKKRENHSEKEKMEEDSFVESDEADLRYDSELEGIGSEDELKNLKNNMNDNFPENFTKESRKFRAKESNKRKEFKKRPKSPDSSFSKDDYYKIKTKHNNNNNNNNKNEKNKKTRGTNLKDQLLELDPKYVEELNSLLKKGEITKDELKEMIEEELNEYTEEEEEEEDDDNKLIDSSSDVDWDENEESDDRENSSTSGSCSQSLEQ